LNNNSLKSSFCSLDIKNIPPNAFEDMIIVPFVNCAVKNGIDLTGQVKFKKDNNGSWTELYISSGGFVKFTHLYKVNSQVFKEDQGGIQIFSENNNISYEQMEKTLKDFASLGIVYCNIVPQKSGGCYIATVVYGSYDCPPVWVLRRYRDYSLRATWFGRLIIKVYYTISPFYIGKFGHTNFFQSFWRTNLNEFIAKLKSKGYNDTPYRD